MSAITEHLSQLIFNIYEAFTVAFFLKDREHLRCITSVTFSTSFNKNKTIPIEGTLPGWVIKHGQPLIIPNFDKEEAALGYYGNSEGIKSFMGYPMENQGVIIIDSKKKWVFTDKEKKILGGFASVIQKELERERRLIDTEDNLDELRTEHRIIELFSQLNSLSISIDDVFRECLAYALADFCFVAMEQNGRVIVYNVYGIDNTGYITKECPRGTSVAAIIIEGGHELLLPHDSSYLKEKPLLFNDETIKARQLFAFPLTSDDITIGAVGFATSLDRPMKDHSIPALRNITSLLSLYYKSLWMKKGIDKLRDIDPVTGGIQFSTFLRIVEKKISSGKPFSLLSIKIMNLDAFNRRMGLEFTNSLLQKAFQIIRHYAGANSLISRKGGGHFFILTKNVDMLEMRNILKILTYAVRKDIEEERIPDKNILIRQGMSRFPKDAADLWELFDIAETKKERAQ